MNWHRILSGLLAATYVVLTYDSGGAGRAMMTLARCLMPLACIWWPEELGQYVGTIRGQAMEPTPARLVRVAGWALLLLPVLIWLLRPLCMYRPR